MNHKLTPILLLLFYLLINFNSNAQCPNDVLNYHGDMSSNWGYWSAQSNWRNTFGSTGYAYVDLDGASNRTLSHSLTGLSNNNSPYIIEFDIWSNNFDDDPSLAGTTGTLVFSIGGVSYATFLNPTTANGNVSVATSNGATCNISSFPVTHIADEAWTHVVLNLNYSGPMNGNLQFSFSSSPPEGDDFAIDNVTMCLDCYYEVFDNEITSGDQPLCMYASPQTIIAKKTFLSPSGSYSYQWQYSVNGTVWYNVPIVYGGTGKNFDTSAMIAANSDNPLYFRRMVGTPCSNNMSYSNVVYVTAGGKPNAGSDINNLQCSGLSTTQNILGSPTTGTWTAQPGNPAGATLSSTTAGEATVTFSNYAVGGDYYFIYTDVNTCKDTMKINFDPCIEIAGNIFDDGNGLTDLTVNGILIGSVISDLFCINVLNSTGTQVVDVIPVSSSGSFSAKYPKNTTYLLDVSTTCGVIGSTTIPPRTLPTEWVQTGEHIGTSAGNDGSADGQQQVAIATASIYEINFGIDKLPNSDSFYEIISSPIQNSFLTLNGGSNPPILNGSDLEDGTKGVGSKLKITSLPTNGKLWYNGVEVFKDDIINNFNPNLLQVQFTGSGYTTTTFEYAFIDNADKIDPTPASYKLEWGTPLPIQIVSFNAKISKVKTVQLELETMNERNLSIFKVQRSSDGFSWDEIGNIIPKNSNTISKYLFTDISPKENNLYRIKIVNTDKYG